MRPRLLLIAILIMLSAISFAQKGRKMSKNLKIYVSENFNRKASITIQQTGDDKGGALGAFTNALASKGFKTISSTSISNKTEIDESKNKTEHSSDKKTTISNTSYVKSKYLFTFQYAFYERRSPGNGPLTGELQCHSFTGQIVDLNNNSEIIATFNYSGNFDMYAIAESIAQKLNDAKTVVFSQIEKTDSIKAETTNASAKSKEDRLLELKQFYEKKLITKKEYETGKAKILAEN